MGRLSELIESVRGMFARVEAVACGDETLETLEPFLNGKTSVAEVYNKLAIEIRKQLQFLLEIQKTMVDVENVLEFQRVVLDEIKQESPELQRRITERLTRMCAIHASTALKN